jgi:Histidine kinase-, DNA gyrase B-, and HSP90-like ATPase
VKAFLTSGILTKDKTSREEIAGVLTTIGLRLPQAKTGSPTSTRPGLARLAHPAAPQARHHPVLRLHLPGQEVAAGPTADAVGRLREIVGLLRDDGEPAPIQPAEEDVAALVDRTAASGVDVRLEQDGDPTPLPPLVDRAVYRTVQESLTNATKHAPGAPVLVRLRHDADQITVEVTNGPASKPPPVRGQGGGGLLALAERVRLVGGRLTAGAHRDGFRVSARLPRRVGASPAPAGDRAAITPPRSTPIACRGWLRRRASSRWSTATRRC